MACGHSADEALRLALAQVTDWTQLAHGVTCATTEGALMSHHAKTLWLPGVTMFGCAATVLLALGFPVAFTMRTDDGFQFGYYFELGNTTFIEIFDQAAR